MLIGDKVGLRPVEEGDLPLLVQWRNRPRTRIKFLAPLLLSVVGQKKWYEALLNDPTRMQFMIVRLEDNVPIGTIGLSHIDYRNQSCEPGSVIIAPSERGQHLAHDAMSILLRYIFYELNLHRAYATVLDFNRNALLGAQALGWKREGVARKAAFVNGEFHDVIYLGLLRKEWQDDTQTRRWHWSLEKHEAVPA